VALVAAPAAWKGPSLPRVEVLLAAHQKWEIEWDLIDASTLFRKLKPSTQEQLVLPLLRSIREEDVEVIEVVTGNDRFVAQDPRLNKRHRNWVYHFSPPIT
jgi:hypothetical protein